MKTDWRGSSCHSVARGSQAPDQAGTLKATMPVRPLHPRPREVARSWAINKGGYVFILMPNHPKAHKHGYIKRAVLVAEEVLGRHLFPGEVTHHINGIKDDDRPENIQVLYADYHNSITMKERWLKTDMKSVLFKK